MPRCRTKTFRLASDVQETSVINVHLGGETPLYFWFRLSLVRSVSPTNDEFLNAGPGRLVPISVRFQDLKKRR